MDLVQLDKYLFTLTIIELSVNKIITNQSKLYNLYYKLIKTMSILNIK